MYIFQGDNWDELMKERKNEWSKTTIYSQQFLAGNTK